MADVAAMDIVLGSKVDGATGGLKTVRKELGETATAAVKLDSTLDATSKSLTNIGGIAVRTAKSFDSVAAEVFSAADAFNAKWNPVVEEAITEAAKATTQVNTLTASFAKMGAGFRTTANY